MTRRSFRSSSIEYPVIVEEYGYGVQARTQTQLAQIIYQVVVLEADGLTVRWRKAIPLQGRSTSRHAPHEIAAEQDKVATTLMQQRAKERT
jgi:hypothetical protein